MPARFVNSISGQNFSIHAVDFIEDDDGRFFKLSGGSIEVLVPYVPTTTSNWDPDLYELHLFENPYLNAENDVFQLYEESLGERIGWLFPVTILESNDNDFVNFSNLNHYKFVAISKLLQIDIDVDQSKIIDNRISLFDVFGDVIVCIFCKRTLDKIDNFQFKNYILSFHNHGYILFSGSSLAKPIFDLAEFVRVMRQERRRVNIKKANTDIYSYDFNQALFADHLLQSDSYLVRFVLLYQIIEQSIHVKFNEKFQLLLDDFSNNVIGKNDFREEINNIAKERVQIRELFAEWELPQQAASNFGNSCDLIFLDAAHRSRDGIGDKLYDIRNMVTHNFRELRQYEDNFIRVVCDFEFLVKEILISNSVSL